MRISLVVKIFLAGMTAGCAALSDSNIPGLSASPILIGDKVSMSEVLSAVTCEISEGYRRVEELKKNRYRDNDTAKSFEYQGGTGTFSGTISTNLSNTASVGSTLILAGLPASSNGAPSNIAPGVDGALNKTKTRTDVLSFSIVPRIERANDEECKNLKVGVSDNSISSALVDHFLTTIDAASRAETETFNLKAVDTTLVFVIQKTTGLGVGATTYPAAPYTISILPKVAASRTRTGTYTLNIKLPTARGNTDNAKRLIYCVSKGRDRLCEEGPFSVAEKQRLLGILRQQVEEEKVVVVPPNTMNLPQSSNRTEVNRSPVTMPSDREGPGF